MAAVTTEQELRDAIAASDPQITVLNDIALTLTNTVNYDLELTSNNFRLSWNGAQNTVMFSVTDGAAFTIANIVLYGAVRNVTLVSVQASTFVMNTGAALQNSSANGFPAVAIGISTDLTVGGAFLMNAGSITGVRAGTVIICWGGTITMLGDAAITQNYYAGILLQGGTLNMGGNAGISGNVANVAAMGVRASGNSVINMGLAPGDTPFISNNRSTATFGGGVWLEGQSTLNMDYGASISGNNVSTFAAGVGLNNSTLNMNGDASISGNIAQNSSGSGVYATASSQVVMDGSSTVFNNEAPGTNSFGGGVYLHSQGTNTLTMRGNASIYGNSANGGAGVYISFGINNSLVMGVDATDTPSITGNSARTNYGGIYISGTGTATLSAQSRIANNTAATVPKGVHNSGTLLISQNVQINDSLYFNSLDAVPVIEQSLGVNASIQLDNSEYVAEADIPVVVAVKGDAYAALTETDRAAFLAPVSFSPGIGAYLNADMDEVLLGAVMEIQEGFLSITRIG